MKQETIDLAKDPSGWHRALGNVPPLAQVTASEIRFTVPCLPVAQPRPKATTVHGMTRLYEAKKSHPIHTFKASIKLAAAEAYKGPLLEGPLAAHLVFIFPAKKKARVWKATKPDADNIAKAVLDSLNGVLYADDGQVCCLTVCKWHAAKDDRPGVEIRIEFAK